jgi:hypothetical protein
MSKQKNYTWVNNPFVDPLDVIRKRNQAQQPKRKYKSRRSKFEDENNG